MHSPARYTVEGGDTGKNRLEKLRKLVLKSWTEVLAKPHPRKFGTSDTE